jgi:hypothetical protein
MTRPTSDEAMRLISALRSDDADCPEDALGANYLRSLVDGLLEVPMEAGGAEHSRVPRSASVPLFDGRKRPRTHRALVVVGGLTAAISISIVAVLTLTGVLSLTTSTSPQQPTPWRVVAATSPLPFVAQTPGPAPQTILMTCPSESTCYAVGNGKRGLLSYKTSDGGSSWRRLSVPPGIVIANQFSCPTASTCFVAAFQTSSRSAQNVLLMTTDGGENWTVKPALAGGEGGIDCPSPTTCVVVVTRPNYEPDKVAGPNNGPDTVPHEYVYWSTDAGTNWREVSDVPSGLLASLDCPTTTTCIGLAYSYPSTAPFVESLRTTDGGQTWHFARLRLRGIAFHAPACSDANHCVAIAQTVPVPNSRMQGHLVALTSTNGGQAWQTHNLPADVATDSIVTGLSCPTDVQCWAALLLHQETRSPQPVIAATSDGGGSWQQDPIADPCASDGCYADIQTLQCPAPSACLALANVSNFRITPVLLTNRPFTST